MEFSPQKFGPVSGNATDERDEFNDVEREDWAPGADEFAAQCVDELVDKRFRSELRRLAKAMKNSGALRIKAHQISLRSIPASFKGEYAAQWLQTAVPYVQSEEDAVRVAQAMLDMAIFVHYLNLTTFKPTQDALYMYTEDLPDNMSITLHSITRLRKHVVQLEDMQYRSLASNEEQRGRSHERSVQLDWRLSVAEARAVATEHTLQRSLVVQQLLVVAILAGAATHFLPLGRSLADIVAVLAVVMVVGSLLESRRVLYDYMHLKIDYERMAKCIAGMELEADYDSDDELQDSQARMHSVSQDTSFTNAAAEALRLVHRRAMSLVSNAAPPGGASVAAATDAAPPGHLHAKSEPAIALGHPSPLQPPDAMTAGPTSPFAGPQLNPPAAVPEDAVIGAPVGADEGGTSSRKLRPQGSIVKFSTLDDWKPSARARSNAVVGPPQINDFNAGAHPDVLVRQPAGPIALVSEPDVSKGRLEVNTGRAFMFDGPLFEGRISAWIAGLPVAPQNEYVFKGRRRKTWYVVQGRFKRPLKADEVYTGQRFSNPIKHPFRWMLSSIVKMIVQSFTSLVNAGTIVDTGETPAVMFLLLLAANSIHVAEPGSEPEMQPRDECEDMRLAVPGLTWEARNNDRNVASRRQHFSKACARQEFTFDPKYVYTFHVWQHVVDAATFKLPMLKLNLINHLEGQPIRFMAMDCSSNFPLWNVEIWHSALLDAAWRPHLANSAHERDGVDGAVEEGVEDTVVDDTTTSSPEPALPEDAHGMRISVDALTAPSRAPGIDSPSRHTVSGFEADDSPTNMHIDTRQLASFSRHSMHDVGGISASSRRARLRRTMQRSDRAAAAAARLCDTERGSEETALPVVQDMLFSSAPDMSGILPDSARSEPSITSQMSAPAGVTGAVLDAALEGLLRGQEGHESDSEAKDRGEAAEAHAEEIDAAGAASDAGAAAARQASASDSISLPVQPAAAVREGGGSSRRPWRSSRATSVASATADALSEAGTDLEAETPSKPATKPRKKSFGLSLFGKGRSTTPPPG